jgi:hypothetical protein
LSDWEYQTLNAMKENIDLLTGARGRNAATASALTRGSVTVANPPAQTMTQVSAYGAGFTISGVSVPSLDDYVKLVANVQQLANDVASLRGTVEALLNQLRG